MGEIAEALRKANESVDGSKVETDPTLRKNEETSGEITAALSRASADCEDRAPSEVDASPRPRTGSPNRSPQDTTLSVPDNLGRIIFHVEHHRHLGLRLRTELERGSAPSLAIVSAVRNEGKSIVACNVAAAIASLSSQRSVALVDLDLRSPSIAQMLQIRISVGIEQVLQGRAQLDEARVSLAEPEIDVYPSAQPHRAAHELLVLPAFETFIRELEARYSAVIIDTPPTLLVPDSTLIMHSVGHCLAIARAGMSRVHYFTDMLDRLPREKMLGKVLNNVPLPSHERGDYYYYQAEDSK